MEKAELLKLAEVENNMADWLDKEARDRRIDSAFDAALVCLNRAAALRALAEKLP